jgi:hypothetical protein
MTMAPAVGQMRCALDHENLDGMATVIAGVPLDPVGAGPHQSARPENRDTVVGEHGRNSVWRCVAELQGEAGRDVRQVGSVVSVECRNDAVEDRLDHLGWGDVASERAPTTTRRPNASVGDPAGFPRRSRRS